jgi:hypothetical protein
MISMKSGLREERVSVDTVPQGKQMMRHEFARYLEPRAEMLGIQLDPEGSTAGLPNQFHHAIAVAQFLHALGQPTPHPDDVREWYGVVEFGTGEVGRHAHWLLGTLRAWDFQELSYPDLLFAMTRASNLEGLLRVLLLRARSKHIAGSAMRTKCR